MLPHALAALASAPPVRKLPKQDMLLLALLQLSHQQACSATEATAAASPLHTTTADTSSSDDDSADERSHTAAGSGRQGEGYRAVRGGVAGRAVPNPWADNCVRDRLLVSIANGRDVASAAALHALCAVYRGVRASLVQHIHSDDWCAYPRCCRPARSLWHVLLRGAAAVPVRQQRTATSFWATS